MKVTKETIDIKIPASAGVGYHIELDSISNKKVNLRFFKGVSHAEREMFELERLIMIRIRVQFVGDLHKFVPIDTLAAREVIQSVDIDLSLLEIFFNKKQKGRETTRLMSPIVQNYLGNITGQYLGTIQMTYGEFTDLVNFLQYLSHGTNAANTKL